MWRIQLQNWIHQQWWLQCTPKRIVDVVGELLHLWFLGILQKKLLCIFVEVNKTMFGNNEGVPDKLLDIFLLSCPGIRNHMNWQVGAPDPVFPQSHWTMLIKQEFIIHNSVTQLVQYSLFTMPTMSTIYDKPGAGWNRINTDNCFKNHFKLMKWVMWYNKKKNYNTTTVWRGSHSIDDNEKYQSCLLKIKWNVICYSMCDEWIWRVQRHHSRKASKTVQRWHFRVWGK